MALKANGAVVPWGYGYDGQTSVPASATNVVGLACYLQAMALKDDGSIVAWGDNFYGFTNVPSSATNVIAIAANGYSSMALRANGTVVVWGTNIYGQLTVPASATNIAAIAAGLTHSIALKSGGSIVAWGDNSLGQLNVPATATNVVAIGAGDCHNLALRANGSLVAWGYNNSGQTNIPASATNVTAVAAAGDYCLALKASGSVVAWGDNSHGQLNVPASATNVVAIAAGYDHCLALKADGLVLAWGGNTFNETNVPGGLALINDVCITGIVDANAPGTYPISYSGTNSYGTLFTTNRTVVVRDTIPPTLTLLGQNSVIFTNASRIYVDPGAIAYDTCAGSLAVTTNGMVNPDLPGTYTLSYTSADNYGNTAFTNRTVYVVLPPATPGDMDGDGILSTAEVNTAISNYWVTSPWMRLTNTPDSGGTNVTFALSNEVGGALTVECSTNLTNWDFLGPALPRYFFIDTNAPPGPQHYYRLRRP